MTKIPITLTTYASIDVQDDAVLDLDRGEAMYGVPFASEKALLEHLAINLIGLGLSLSNLDGWADLPDDAVTVKIDDIVSDD
jgi:hypothetical protein